MMIIISLSLLSHATIGVQDNTTTKTQEIFGVDVSEINEKIRSMRYEVLNTFDITPGIMRSLEQRLQKVSNLEHDSIDPSGDSVDEINEKSKIDRELFQSDIVLDKEQAWIIITDIEEESRGLDRTKRQALRDPSGLKYWTNGVNYTFNETLSAKARKAFIEGARLWSKDTCVKFRYDPHGTAKDRLIVQAKDGCWSYVGKSGGLQQTSLGKGCEKAAIAAHEIGHTLGFYHTMSRHDRDHYVIINLPNIKRSWISQFARQTPETNHNFGLDYDYGSIMHYKGSTASINRSQPALVPFDIDYQKTLGSPFISFTDISMLNELYGCKKWCDGKAIVKCENGGYPHPRFCWKCVCPGGYAGRRCTERPDEGCGKTIEASKNWKTLSNVLGNRTVRRVLEKYNKCNYWIQSPEGTEIEIKLKYFSKKFAVDGCPYAGVEIKTNEKQQLTGYRFCSPDAAGTKLRSHTNRVPIIIWNKIYLSKTILRYRYVPAEKPRPTTVRPTTHMTTWPATRRRVTSTAAPTGEEQAQRSPEMSTSGAEL